MMHQLDTLHNLQVLHVDSVSGLDPDDENDLEQKSLPIIFPLKQQWVSGGN